jgi:hypothetical protein
MVKTIILWLEIDPILGSPCFDIAKFLATSFDAEIRREIMEGDLVERFYGMLVDEYAKQSDGKMKPNFTVEQVKLISKDHFLFTFLGARTLWVSILWPNKRSYDFASLLQVCKSRLTTKDPWGKFSEIGTSDLALCPGCAGISRQKELGWVCRSRMIL